MDFDRFSEGRSVNALDNTNITTATDTYGETIDTQYYGSLVVGLIISDVTSGTITGLTFQESDDAGMAGAADVDDSEILINDGELPISTAGTYRIGTISKKRYVRLKITTTGTVDITGYAVGEKGNAISQPKEISSSVLETAEINAPGQTADSIVTHPKRTS